MAEQAGQGGHIELERSLDSIVVGIRHRQHPEEGIEPLMASIKSLGLLQPITITPDGVLVCGARRLAAVRQLGWRSLRVWVRSGISDDLNRLLAQQDENEQRKALDPREQAALFRELRKLMAEDGARRQEASRFGTGSDHSGGSGGESGAVNGAAESAAPRRGHGDARRQAAVAVTGKASYSLLEQISAIEHVAADRSLPETVRKLAEAELADIQRGGDVNPAYFRVLAAKELIAADDAAMPTGPVSDEELDALATEALERVRQGRPRRGLKSSPHPGPGVSRRTLRAFLLTWGDLDGWSRFHNPTEIATQLTQDNWEMFERVIVETVRFADEVRDLRAARVPA